MKVKVANRVYEMGPAEYKNLQLTANEQVPFGIHAIEKSGYAELRCDKCSSMGELKRLIRHFKQQGFKVYSNCGKSS